MSNTITSTYMGMPQPIPTVDPGPQYATDINNCLTIIDQHNHTPGSGQQVPTQGININLDLPFNSFNATSIRTARFSTTGLLPSTGSDTGCIYVSGVDLFYNDLSGNRIRITQSGSIAGTPGGITNLSSPASLTYVTQSQSFVFQSAVQTAAGIDGASIILRNPIQNSNGITIAAATGLTGNYSLVLPGSLPASTKFLTVDQNGNVGDTYDVDNSSLVVLSNTIQVKSGGITQQMRAPAVYAASTGSFNFQTGSQTFVQVTSMNLTLTTTGRPVFMELIGDGQSANPAVNGVGLIMTTGSETGVVNFLLDGSSVGTISLQNAPAQNIPPLRQYCLPSSGSHTFAVQARVINGTGAIDVSGMSLLVYEI